MADYTQTPQGGFAPHEHPEYAVASDTPTLTRLTNFAGAAISLALVVGIGVWGYKLLVRDVSGIPVVRAVAGEMRVRPEEPGGNFAEHQGLSVNTIAAIGTAGEHAQSLRLAPQPTDLAEEDAPMPELAEASLPAGGAPEQLEEPPAADDIAAALESGTVDDIVAQLTNGIAPMDALEAESKPVLASVSAQDVDAALAATMDDGSGVQVSLRPAVRPAAFTPTASAPAAAATSVSSAEIDAGSLPVGTRLVQLGAFDTPEIARAQWGTLSQRFGPFMEGKNRVVMEAKSGGRTFYRLRAEGFEDIGDARRFCSALVAENVDCIPVVTR